MSNANLSLPSEWDAHTYRFELPPEAIAQFPAQKRDHSRMMLLSLQTTEIKHYHFYDIVDLLPANTALVVNNTKVLPVRLLGVRATGGQTEALLVTEKRLGVWVAMIKRAKRIKLGERLSFCDGRIEATTLERLDNGQWVLEFDDPTTLMERLSQFALPPLPPYIERSHASEENHIEDRKRYQTCYAQNPGAVAAPTAGLHFTPEVLQRLEQKGIPLIEVTLHVGIGTFATIRSQDIRDHQIHSEYYEISESNLSLLKQSLKEKRKLVAVGTTSVRVLETLAKEPSLSQASGWTDIFIYPPYQFQLVQGLLTNFHLPDSTLILLVSALYGRDKLLYAYQTAIEEHYRFFSYGDCMLIL